MKERRPVIFPKVDYSSQARMSTIRYSELLKLIAAHKVQADHENGTYLLETQEQYIERLNSKIRILKEIVDNAIDAGDISFSKRTATAEMEELNELIETAEEFGWYGGQPPEAYDIRANLDINIRSFVLWASNKQIPLPAIFYSIHQIEPPKPLKLASLKATKTDTENTKITENLLKMLIAIAIDGYGYKPHDKKNTTVQDISKALDSCGLSLSENTIRTRLKEAAELLPPDMKTL